MGNAESIRVYDNSNIVLGENIAIDRNIRVHVWEGDASVLPLDRAVFNLTSILPSNATFANASRYTFVNHDASSPALPIVLATQTILSTSGVPMKFIDTTGAALEQPFVLLSPHQAVTLVLDTSSPEPSWIFFADPMDFASA